MFKRMLFLIMALFVCTVGAVAVGEDYTLFRKDAGGNLVPIEKPYSCIEEILGTDGSDEILMTPVYQYNCANGLVPNASNDGCDNVQYEPYAGYYTDLTTGNNVGCPVGYYCPGSGYVVSGISSQEDCENAVNIGIEWRSGKCYIKDTDITVRVTSESLCNSSSNINHIRFEWISGQCKFFSAQNVANNQYICDEGGTVDTQNGTAIGLCKCPEGTTTTDDTEYGKGRNASDVAQCRFYTCNPGEQLKVENGVASCQPCDEGHYCVGGAYDIAHTANSMKACPTKLYANSENTPAGSFRCAYSCPAGKSMLVIGDWYRADTDCAPCPEGVYCPGDDGNPKTYFAPTVYDETDNNNLREFALGSKYLGTESCPEGERTLGFENTSADACRQSFACPAGKYLDVSKIGVEEDPCTICDDGYYCPGGNYSDANDGEVEGKVGMYKCQQYFVRQERADHSGWDTVFNPTDPDENSMFYSLSVPTASRSACTCPDGFEWKSETQTCCAPGQFCCPRGKEIYTAKNGTKMCQTCSNKDVGGETVLDDNDNQYYCPGSIVLLPWHCTPTENQYYNGSCVTCGEGSKPSAGDLPSSCVCDRELMSQSSDQNLNVYDHSSLVGTDELVHRWDYNTNTCKLNDYYVGVYYTEIYSSGAYYYSHGTGTWRTDYYWSKHYTFVDNEFTVSHTPDQNSMNGVVFAGWCRGKEFCCEEGYKEVITNGLRKCEACEPGDTSESCNGAAYVAPTGCQVGYKLVDMFGQKACVECGDTESGSAECDGSAYTPISQMLKVDPKSAYDRTYHTVYLQRRQIGYECAAGYYLNTSGLGTDEQCIKCEAGHWCPGSKPGNPLTIGYIGKHECDYGRYNSLEEQGSEDACLKCSELELNGRTWSNLTTEGKASVSPAQCGYYCEAGKYAASGTWACDQTCTVNPNPDTTNPNINPDGSSYCPGNGYDNRYYYWDRKFYTTAGQGRYPCPNGLTADDGAKNCYKICTEDAQYVQKQSNGEYICKYCDGNVPSEELNKGKYYYCPYKDIKLGLTVSRGHILNHDTEVGKLDCGAYQKSDEPASECYDSFREGVWKDDFGNVGECWANAYCPGGTTSGMVQCPLGSVSEPGAGTVEDCKCLSDVDLEDGETPKYRPDGVYAEKGASLYEVSEGVYVCVNTYLVTDNDYYFEHPGQDGAVGPANARVVSCRWGSDSQTEGKYDICTSEAMRVCYDTQWNNILDPSKKALDVLEILADAFNTSVERVYGGMTKLENQNVKDVDVVGECAVLECPINYPNPIFDSEEYTELTSLSQCHAKVDFYANNGETLDAIHEYLVQYTESSATYKIPAEEFPTEDPETYPLLKKKGHTLSGWYQAATPDEGDVAVSADDDFAGNTSLYANWTPNDYKVTYVCGTAEQEPYDTVKFGEGPYNWKKSANECSENGYDFGDFECEDSENTSVVISDDTVDEWDIASDVACTASKTAHKYNIVYDGIDIDKVKALPVANPVEYYITSDSLGLYDREMDHYNFGGWCKYDSEEAAIAGKDSCKDGAICEDAINTKNCMVPNQGDANNSSVIAIKTGSFGDRWFYAIWNAKQYNIKYHLNNGECDDDACADDTYTVEDGDINGEISLPASDKLHYEYRTFAGWYDNESLTEPSVTKFAVADGGDRDFYAKWDPVEFTVKLKLNGGTCTDAYCGACAELDSETGDCVDADLRKFATFTVESDAFDLPLADNDKLTKTDNKFMAWCLEGEETQNCLAAYTDKIVTDENTDTQTAVHVRTIAQGTHEDLTFEARWVPTICPLGYTHRDASDDLTDLTKCYAIVSYDTGDETLVPESIKKYYNETVGSSYKLSAEELPNITKTGHDFVAWYDRDIAVTTETVFEPVDFGNGIPTLDRTLKANWTPYSYTIKFDSNGADSGEPMTDMTGLEYGKTYSLNPNTFEYSGYSFEGWCTKFENDSCVGTTYSDGGSVHDLTDEKNGVVTLYAMWTTNTYTVHFKKNAADTDATGAKADKDDCAFNEPCDITNYNEFVGIDYEFVGWKEEGTETTYVPNSEGKIFMTKAPSDDQEVTLLAIWTPVCNTGKYLHIGDDVRMCLYATSRTTPSLVILIDDVKYYANMCKAPECDKTITGDTERKLDIMYNDEVYNVYDLTAQ